MLDSKHVCRHLVCARQLQAACCLPNHQAASCSELTDETQMAHTTMQGLARMAAEKSVKAYFRGNGTNVVKNVPETALKLTLNDRVKSLVCRDGHHITLCAAQQLLTPLLKCRCLSCHLACSCCGETDSRS